MSRKFSLAFVLAIVLISVSGFALRKHDSHEQDGGDKKLVSSFQSNESHFKGTSCMRCHKAGEDCEGWFQVAGSVYCDAPNKPQIIVKIFTEPDGKGKLVSAFEVDKKGNFYSTEKTEFGSGLYASVTNSNGSLTNMKAPVTKGSCNSCHCLEANYIRAY